MKSRPFHLATRSGVRYVCRVANPSALAKILAGMRDGEARTVSKIHYLTGVSPNTIRRAITEGDLVKIGEAPLPAPLARRGQAIVRVAQKHEASLCRLPSNVA